MKKYIIGLFLFGFLFIPTTFTQAQTGDVDPDTNTTECVSIVNNLRYKDRDINKNGEVSTLQDFLQAKNYLNNEPTGYYGLLTVKAVKSFQKNNNIDATGYVGPVTRGMIKKITCSGKISEVISSDIISDNKACASNATPSITVLSPNGGEVYTVGGKMDLKWKSCGYGNNPEVKVSIILLVHDTDGSNSNTFLMSQSDIVNDGFESVTIPANVPVGRNYKIRMYTYSPNNTINGGGPYYKFDTSNSDFTINNSSVDTTNKYDVLASCIKNSGATLYGTFWCSHCENQKKLFGASASKIPYVECSTENGLGQTQICLSKGISGYPTWTFADGTSLSGEQSLQKLAEKTSCSLPN